ncbi:MAG: single-stranded DNA-binding protein [Bacteroidota bacterium]|nr:single-stranded DNA-binding protein [Bacteroidota bacterium]
MTNLKNSVRLIGHLGQKPEVKTIPSGKKVANFSLATNDTYKDAEGQKVSETMWHNLVVWGKQVDTVEKYLDKGQEIAVEGKLMNRNYVDKNGVKKYVTEIFVNDFQMIGGKGKEKVKVA